MSQNPLEFNENSFTGNDNNSSEFSIDSVDEKSVGFPYCYILIFIGVVVLSGMIVLIIILTKNLN